MNNDIFVQEVLFPPSLSSLLTTAYVPASGVKIQAIQNIDHLWSYSILHTQEPVITLQKYIINDKRSRVSDIATTLQVSSYLYILYARLEFKVASRKDIWHCFNCRGVNEGGHFELYSYFCLRSATFSLNLHSKSNTVASQLPKTNSMKITHSSIHFMTITIKADSF